MTLTLPDTRAAEEPGAGPTPPRSRGGSRARRVLRGREQDPAWVRPALLGLLGLTALLYLWGLGASGWANAFYSAAVQAGTKSWKAMFFGSSDASNFITVDKPPASLWVMDISARIFGVNSWSILVPQALEGVAAVGLLYATVRRWFTPAAALLSGAILALTPVAVLMFRFNNPDALLVLLLVGGAYATTRAVESGRTRWLVLAGALVGTGFITKMLQAFLVVPAFVLVYLWAGPTTFGRRFRQLVVGGVAMLVAAGWWVAVVELWPASSRPYIGGSSDNSILNLIFGYNGFGRLSGNEVGSVGGGNGTGGGRWGATGLLRMFNSEMGTQISWLLPAALLLLVAFLVVTWRTPRTDRTRAAFLLWGGWLVVTAATLSFGQGIIHPYYTVALAPAIGVLVGVGGALLWRGRAHIVPRLLLVATIVLTAIWSYVLLNRTPDWYPEVRWIVLLTGLAAALGVLVLPRLVRGLALVVAGAALISAFAGPAAYALDTAATPHSGAIPSAGPATGFGLGGGGGGGRPAGGGQALRQLFGGGTGTAGTNPFGQGGRPAGGGNFGGGGGGGLLDASTPSAALTSLIKNGASGYTWAAATVGSNSAAGVQLASGKPIMAIGGFNGTDPAPTLAQFQKWVSEGKIHYFLGSTGGGFGGGSSTTTTTTASQIQTWVAAHYTATTVGGQTVYDLSNPTS